jgi:hypothetical protein
VLIKYHTGGDANAALLLFEMAEIEKTIALEREAKKSSSYMDMFRTKGNRHRLLITVTLGIFGQWVGKWVFRILLQRLPQPIPVFSPLPFLLATYHQRAL